MPAQRFEIELLTTFKEQGLEAAVARMQQYLRQINAPNVSGGGTDAARQVAEFNAARVQFERSVREASSAGQFSDAAARNARTQITNEINGLLRTNQEFARAIRTAEENGVQLLRNTAQVRSAASAAAQPPGRPSGPATTSGGPATSPAVQRTLDQAGQLQSDRVEGDLAVASALLATERRRLAAQTGQILAADESYRQASIRLAATRAQLAAAEATGRRVDPTALQAEIAKRYETTLSNATRDVEVNRQLVQTDEALATLGRQKIAVDERNLAVREEANRIAVQANNGAHVLAGGSTFQRAQASIAARQTGGVVDPSRFQTGGQFVASRAFTTAGFALSGAALYGGVNALKSMVTETEQLDAQFALLQQQFTAAGKAGQLPEFRRAMLDIARQTGITADQVVNIGFQLQGAFNDTTEAINNTNAAMKLVRISGLSVDEVTNDMTATATTYGVTFEQIGDAVTSLERRYGVLASQSLNTFGQMSNTAHQAGLSFEQLTEIIGAVSRVSGRSSSAIAESFNRILPSIQSSATQIQQIYATALDAGQIDQGQFDKITKALSQGQSGQALIDILRDYDKFNQAQQNQLQFTLGGARESQTIAPLVQQRSQILAGSQRGAGADSGALQRRFDSLTQTLQQRLDRVAERFRQLGVQIGEAGLLDALKLLAGGLLIVLDATSRVLSVFNAADDLFGGIPSKIVAVVIAVKLLQIAIQGLRQFGSAASGILGGRTGLDSARGVVEDVAAQAQGQAQRRTATSYAAAAPLRSTEQGTLFDQSTVQRTIRDRLSTVINNAAQSVRNAPSAVSDRWAATAQTGTQGALPGFGQFAATAQTINTSVGTAGKGFATSVGVGLRTLGQRIQQQLIALGNLNARTNLPGGGGAAGTAGGRFSTFLTGGGGLQGGVMTAFSGLAAASSLVQLRDTYRQNQQQLTQQGSGIRQQLGTKSLDQLLALQKQGTFKDNFATRIGSDIGLNASVGETGSQAIGRATEREFEQALNSGILAHNKDRDRLLKELKDSQGMGKSGEAARKALADLPAKDREKLAEFSKTIGKAAEESDTHGDTNVADIQSIQQQYELGSLSYADYIKKLQTNVDRLRELAAGGDQKAKDNYQKGLQQFIQSMGQLSQQQDQLFQQGLDAQGLTPQEQSAALRNRAGQGIPQEFRSVATPRPAGSTVATPQAAAPQYNDPASKQQRFQQINDLIQKNRQLFDQAAQNVNDPETLEQLRQVFSLSPDQLAEYKALAEQLGVALGDTGELTIQAKQLEAARDRALQLATTRAQAAIAGLSDPGAIAQKQGDLANQQFSNAQLVKDPGERDQAVASAQLAQAQAARQQRDAADAADQARLQAQGAVVARDPVAAARNQIAQAQLAGRQARDNVSAQYQAQSQLIQAQQQLEEAQKQISQSRINLFKAQHPQDVIAQAQAAQREADLAVQTAHSDAARLDAQAQRVAADRQMQDALRTVADAQSNLIQAQLTASGNLVGAAEEGLTRAQRALDAARQHKDGPEVIAQLKTDVVNAKDTIRRQQLSDSQDLIQFNLQMGTYTRAQAIAQYQLLLAVANPKERQQLLLQIRQLQQAASSADLQFNMPSNIDLPTLYTARRSLADENRIGSGQVYASGSGGQVMNDNRQITIELNATNAVDGQAAVKTIVDALNEAPRFGTQPRLY